MTRVKRKTHTHTNTRHKRYRAQDAREEQRNSSFRDGLDFGGTIRMEDLKLSASIARCCAGCFADEKKESEIFASTISVHMLNNPYCFLYWSIHSKYRDSKEQKKEQRNKIIKSNERVKVKVLFTMK